MSESKRPAKAAPNPTITVCPPLPMPAHLVGIDLGHPSKGLPPVSPDTDSGLTKGTDEGATRPFARTDYLQVHGIDYFENFTLPPDSILVGDCHLTRGDITVLGGVPGCGKSRLITSLAVAGSQGPGAQWMGLPVHSPFSTFVLQAENGEVRLKSELEAIRAQGFDLDGWLHLTPPPPYGLAFTNPDFRYALKDWLAEIRPGVLAIDPWNRCTQDDKAKDYRAVLDAVYAVLPDGADKPAVVIVHHLRKQVSGDSRKRGRDLLNELSGSYVIGSACRVAFILEPATPEGHDDRVIFTCAKNNNGDMGTSTAWHRRDGLFARCESFDWEEWGGGEGKGKRSNILLDDLSAIFEGGTLTLTRREAVAALQKRCDVKESTAYSALKIDGRFADHLVISDGRYRFQR